MRKKDQVTPMDVRVSGGSARRVPGPLPGGGAGADLVTTGLQKLFGSIANEPIPEEFLRLLDEIDESSKRNVPGDRE